MSHHQPKRRARSDIPVIVAAVLCFTYVISMGPVYGFCVHRRWVEAHTLHKIYHPLWWLGRDPEQGRRSYLHRYIEWWKTNLRP